jgi:hypothetical protein
MTPRRKFVFLIFALIVPYMAFVMYFALRSSQPGQILPTWFPYFGLSYILGSMVLVMVASRRIFRNVPQEASPKAQSALRWGRAWAMYLVAIWSGFFIYGAYRTLKGDFPMERAIPAGAFLLAFIGLFSWSLYRDYQARKHPTIKQ